MQLKQLFEDEGGVSPVIGVILMVAITVILAAVIGTFVLNLGQNVNNSAPTVSFDFEGDAGSGVTITHNGGAKLESVSVSNCGTSPPSEWTAGESIECSSGDIDGSKNIVITWEDPDSDQSSIIGEYEP